MVSYVRPFYASSRDYNLTFGNYNMPDDTCVRFVHVICLCSQQVIVSSLGYKSLALLLLQKFNTLSFIFLPLQAR